MGKGNIDAANALIRVGEVVVGGIGEVVADGEVTLHGNIGGAVAGVGAAAVLGSGGQGKENCQSECDVRD